MLAFSGKIDGFGASEFCLTVYLCKDAVIGAFIGLNNNGKIFVEGETFHNWSHSAHPDVAPTVDNFVIFSDCNENAVFSQVEWRRRLRAC